MELLVTRNLHRKYYGVLSNCLPSKASHVNALLIPEAAYPSATN